jgi:putative phosphoserine phosphatase/1-acylglycerol-3-phosphate O-acyltransferase
MKPLVDAMRNEGKSVALAPEGTRTVSPNLGPFKKGAFHLAIQAGVPMVPVVIRNAGDVAPKGDFIFRPATVEVDVLPPVDTSDWTTETIDDHVRDVRNMFLKCLGQTEEKAPAAEKSKTKATAAKAKKKPATKATTKPRAKSKAPAKTKTPVAKSPAKAKSETVAKARPKTAIKLQAKARPKSRPKSARS